ncbi:MAG TPA: 4-(cytidine 5'-diphospho)-2-C-methyl-D-erythritol kinase [Chthoniobacterales bacterium]
MRIRTAAKINLTLELRGRRADGFHEIATWMVPVGLYDDLEIERSEAPAFVSNVPALGWDAENLIYRAAELFNEAVGQPNAAYRVQLEKHIPLGAGLAGGSSDAAATLRTLNALHGGPLPARTLVDLAGRLGSDVAFFIRQQPAWCTGRGEIMKARPFPGRVWCLLVKPGFGIATASAYAAYAKLRPDENKGESVETRWGLVRNDLEPAVFPKYLVLPVLKRWMRAQAETELSLMSGSGSTLFALTASEDQAKAVRERFLAFWGQRFWTFIAEGNPDPGAPPA